MAPFLEIMFGLITLTSVYSVFKSLVFNMHMFQLNGYRFSTHISWLKKNISHYIPEVIVLALSFTGLIESESIMCFCAVALFGVVFALIISNRNRAQKKPLVYTLRVKRMIFTSVLLFLLAYGGAVICLTGSKKHLAFLVLGAINAFVPLLVLLANAINTPVEHGVNRHYLNEAKAMLRSCPDLQTIGITGSYGKTSVKFYLYTILRAWTDTLVTPASYNTPMGIVKTIRSSLSAVHKIFLCEMGAKWVGDIKELCDIVHPKHGIITALGEQHLESFGSKENIIKTKYELSEALPKNGRLYVNWDNETIRSNPPQHAFIKYGTREDCDYRAYNIEISNKGTSFCVKAPTGEEVLLSTKLVGVHNIVNITGAVAAANGFGMPLQEMRLYVRRIEAVPHRMQLVEKGAVTIIDDAYNSNPAGCRAALETLSMMTGTKILVTPGMVELGGKEAELNAEFGAEAARVCDKIVLVGSKQTQPIKDGALKAGCEDGKIAVFENFADAMKYVYGLKSDFKKLVLLENDLPDNY